MKAKVRLDTMTDIKDFIEAATKSTAPIYLTDDNNMKVSATSLLGVMYTMEWSEVYCTCEQDIYHLIERFIVEE